MSQFFRVGRRRLNGSGSFESIQLTREDEPVRTFDAFMHGGRGGEAQLLLGSLKKKKRTQTLIASDFDLFPLPFMVSRVADRLMDFRLSSAGWLVFQDEWQIITALPFSRKRNRATITVPLQNGRLLGTSDSRARGVHLLLWDLLVVFGVLYAHHAG